MLVYDNEALALWIGTQLHKEFLPPYQCIGVARGAELLAVALFNNFDWPSIEITFATTSPRWASRQMIARIIGYPFIELDCRRITAVTGRRNKDARAFLLRFGFHEEGHHPELFENDDGVSYGLLKRDAQKWLEIYRHERPQTTRSTRSLPDGTDRIAIRHQERDREQDPE